MPRRNLLIILFSAAVSLACYQVVERNPYGRYFSDILGKVDRLYVRPVDDRRLFDQAVNGMLKDLDQNSELYDPRRAERFISAIDQHYPGVGIEVNYDAKTKKLLVMGTLVNSPAYAADILIGDQILRVDDTKIADLDFDSEEGMEEATRLIRGPAGTDVRLTLARSTKKDSFEVTLKRAEIKTDSVFGYSRNSDDSWNYWIPGRDGIAYIRLSEFGERSFEELQAALESLPTQKMKGLILDLRFNGGGRLDTAVEICSLFIPKGKTVVTTRGRDNKIMEEQRAIGPGTYQDVPLAVLVNSYSASASEITAACLQDYHRAIVCGQRSYGKGTVQRVLELGENIGALKLTIATFWRPSNKNIHKHKDAKDTDEWGVMPDAGFNVPMTDEQVEAMLKSRRPREIVHRSQPAGATTTGEKPGAANSDDAPASSDKTKSPIAADDLSVDPQLKRAVEYLQKKS